MVNPEGPLLDPVYGYHVQRLEADHIVSMKSISQMPYFDKIGEGHQLEVLNLQENFMGLDKSTNTSMGANPGRNGMDIAVWARFPQTSAQT